MTGDKVVTVPLTPFQRLWAFLNSPFFIAILSGLFIVGALKAHDDNRAAAVDRDTRRAAYVELLAELQLRVSRLREADSRLDEFLGEGPELKGAKPMPATDPRREAFEKASAGVGREQADILGGRGNYVPTAPAFENMDFLTLAARLEHIGGGPDINLSALRLLRGLDASPDVLWLFVRAYLPILQDFVVRRHVLYTNGRMPLVRGAKITETLEQSLGIPDSEPGELEKLQRQNDALHDKLQKSLEAPKEKG